MTRVVTMAPMLSIDFIVISCFLRGSSAVIVVALLLPDVPILKSFQNGPMTNGYVLIKILNISDRISGVTDHVIHYFKSSTSYSY